MLPQLLRQSRGLCRAPSSLLHALGAQRCGGAAAAACEWQQHCAAPPSQSSLDTSQPWLPVRPMSSLLTPESVTQLSAALNAPPHNLRFERPPIINPELEKSFWANMALKMLMFHNPKNQLIIYGQRLYDESVREQVDDFVLQRAFGMDPKIFYSTFTLLSLHVWLIVHRLGLDPDKETRYFVQRFYNQFQFDVERRIYEAGVLVGVGKWSRKLESVFYNSSQELDLVLFKQSSDTFENIILRMFFGGDSSKRIQAELITKYLLYEHECLKLTDKQDILKGNIQFSRFPFERYRRGVHQRMPAQAPLGSAEGDVQGQSS